MAEAVNQLNAMSQPNKALNARSDNCAAILFAQCLSQIKSDDQNEMTTQTWRDGFTCVFTTFIATRIS